MCKHIHPYQYQSRQQRQYTQYRQQYRQRQQQQQQQQQRQIQKQDVCKWQHNKPELLLLMPLPLPPPTLLPTYKHWKRRKCENTTTITTTQTGTTPITALATTPTTAPTTALATTSTRATITTATPRIMIQRKFYIYDWLSVLYQRTYYNCCQHLNVQSQQQHNNNNCKVTTSIIKATMKTTIPTLTKTLRINYNSNLLLIVALVLLILLSFLTITQGARATAATSSISVASTPLVSAVAQRYGLMYFLDKNKKTLDNTLDKTQDILLTMLPDTALTNDTHRVTTTMAATADTVATSSNPTENNVKYQQQNEEQQRQQQQQRQLQQQQLFVLLNSNRNHQQLQQRKQNEQFNNVGITSTGSILLKNMRMKSSHNHNNRNSKNKNNNNTDQQYIQQLLQQQPTIYKPLIIETEEFVSDDGDHYDNVEKDALAQQQNNYSMNSQEQTLLYNNDDCPRECKCLNDYFDCGKKHLDRVSYLPNYVQTLDFVANRLNDTTVLDIKNLHKLNKLVLKRNQLSTVPKFEGLSSLKHLSLANNLIQRISNEALAALPKLKLLDLSKNYLHTIEANYFPKNLQLAHLIFNNNEISTIEENAFENLSELLTLELNFNHLNTLPAGVFGNLGKLKKLSLNHNNVEINWSTFRGLYSLQKLFLKANNIRALQDGLFHVLRSIETIELDHNSITSLSRQGLFNLTKLHHLSLSNNSITHIELDTWEFTQSLVSLDLSYNNISEFKAQHLDCLQRLKHLNLGHNKIQYVMENTFDCVKNLEDLNLRRNKLSWAIEDPSAIPPFKSLRKLKKLDLNGNNLKQINAKSLSGLSNLEHLNLGGNALASIQSGAFDHMLLLQKLILKSINLICDCDILWFKLWLHRHLESATKKQLQTASSQVVCGYPEHLLDHELMSLNENDLTCAATPKPVLTLQPTNQLAVKGANITLECIAISPTAASLAAADELKIKWRHDNKNVKENDREHSDYYLLSTSAALPATYSTTETQIYHNTNKNMTTIKGYLRLFNVTYDTAGKYQCVVSNAFGTTYSEKFKISIGIRPSFLQVPSNLTINSGDTARLVCSATGDPTPEIALQKFGASDFPAATERRLQVIREENAFIITKAKLGDSGIYTCTADSAAGEIKINASLIVNDNPLPDIPVAYKETVLGRPTVLECFNDITTEMIKPQREWYKDNKPVHVTAISEVEHYYFTIEKELLVIVNTQSMDAGRYRCEITDNTKTFSMHTDLVVVRDDFNHNVILVGIVLVTVSCILIGSLFVWIILFHQKKRLYRNNMNSIRTSTGSGARVAAINNRGSALDQTLLTTLNRTYLRSPGTEYTESNQRPRSLAALELNGIRYKEEVDSLRNTINGGQRSCLIVTPTPNYPQFLRHQQKSCTHVDASASPQERNGLLNEEPLTLECIRRNAQHDLEHQHDHLSSKDSGTGSDAAVKRSLEDFSLSLLAPNTSTPSGRTIRRHIGRASLAKPDTDDDEDNDDDELAGEEEEIYNEKDHNEKSTLTITPQQDYCDSFVSTPTIGISSPTEIELNTLTHNNNQELKVSSPSSITCSLGNDSFSRIDPYYMKSNNMPNDTSLTENNSKHNLLQ